MSPLFRLNRLIEDIGEELNHQHGWKKQAAELLGIHASTITRLRNGDLKKVSSRLLTSISNRIGIDSEYFTHNESELPASAFMRDLRTMSPAAHQELRLMGESAYALLGRNASGRELKPNDGADLARRVVASSPEHFVAALALVLQMDSTTQAELAPNFQNVSAVRLAELVVQHVEKHEQEARAFSRSYDLESAQDEWLEAFFGEAHQQDLDAQTQDSDE